MAQQATLTTRKTPEPTTRRQSIESTADRLSIPDQSLACINVDLLGGFRVRAARVSMGSLDIPCGKLRRVLLALILHRGAPVSKDRLVSLLWEGSPPSGAKATLETYVCVLRKKLQPCQDGRTGLITTAAGCYAIDMSRVDLDLVRYERLMSAALQPDISAADALPMLQRAMALAEGPLLPEERDSEWLDEVRGTHSENVRKNLIAAATKVAGIPFVGAEGWARLALEGDPLDEAAWHALLASMEARGQHAKGLRAYDDCRKLFAAELGCAPGPGLQELYVQLLRGANEEDEELSQLFDAVVRLHEANRPTPRSAVQARGKVQALVDQRREANDQARSVEQARRMLTQLLRSIGGGHSRPSLALGA